MSCCSDIYTSAGGSPQLRSHSDSVYIYAESIKGSISCSSVCQDWDSTCLYTEVEKTCDITQDPRSETAKIGSSIEALFGSDSSCDSESIGGDGDSDSSCLNADWEHSFDSDSDSCNLAYSFAEAQWGSASSCSGSAASGYITDCDLESSFSTTEQYGSSAPGRHFEAGHCDSEANCFEGGYHDLPASQYKPGHCDSAGSHFDAGLSVSPFGHFKAGHFDFPVGHFNERGSDPLVGHFEKGHHNSPAGHFKATLCDSPVVHFEAGHCVSPVVHLDAGHCDSPVVCFEAGHCDSPYGYFEAGLSDSPIGHFEMGHCDSPDVHFEAGHCDSSDSHFEAGHCDSPLGHFDEDTCDLYNAFPQSSDAVCYGAQEQDYLFHFSDSSELTWRKLQGVVTHPDHYRIAPFFHEMMKETEHDRNQEKVKINKGFLFHPQRVKKTCKSFYE